SRLSSSSGVSPLSCRTCSAVSANRCRQPCSRFSATPRLAATSATVRSPRVSTSRTASRLNSSVYFLLVFFFFGFMNASRGYSPRWVSIKPCEVYDHDKQHTGDSCHDPRHLQHEDKDVNAGKRNNVRYPLTPSMSRVAGGILLATLAAPLTPPSCAIAPKMARTSTHCSQAR